MKEHSDTQVKVTHDSIRARVKFINYFELPGGTTMLCQLEMVNGYIVNGLAAIEDGNLDAAKETAYEEAFSKCWSLEKYAVRERRHH